MTPIQYINIIVIIDGQSTPNWKLLTIVVIMYQLHDLGLSQETSSPASSMIDGLLVTGGTGLRTLSANWILLVALDAPLPPSGLADKIHIIKSSITAVVKKHGLTDAVKGAWMDRLTRMDLGMESNNHRHRRGLYDIGGVILHGLFGLATDK